MKRTGCKASLLILQQQASMISPWLAISSAASIGHQALADQAPLAAPEMAGVGAGGALLVSSKFFLHR